MRILSLRARISLWTAAITGCALLTLAVSTVTYIYYESLEAIDIHIEGEIHELSSDLIAGELDADEFGLDEFEPGLVLGIFKSSGEPLGTSPHFPLSIAEAVLPAGKTVFANADSKRWRVTTAKSGEQRIIVAQDLEEFRDVLSDLVTAQVIFLPLVAGLTAWLSWSISGQTLSPIRQATAQAASMGANDLRKRLPVGRPDDEIGQFTSVLNGMLSRIEKNYDQARQFAGDASHELSTPLTIIKGEVERALVEDHLSTETENRLLSIAEEADRMNLIIEQLLLLARFDSGKASQDYAELDLSKLLLDLGEDVDLLAARRELTIESDIAPDILLLGDPTHLRRLFLNLFTNAVKYNQPSGSINYRLYQEQSEVVFVISNSGPSIPASHREKIFDRFYQVDSSRAQTGSGLGLSLCREIAQAHGGSIRYRPGPPLDNKFEVSFPGATAARDKDASQITETTFA